MGFGDERLRVRGRLVEMEKEAARLRLLLEGDVHELRACLPPFVPIQDWRVEQAAARAVELAGRHAEYMGLAAEIANMKQALGI